MSVPIFINIKVPCFDALNNKSSDDIELPAGVFGVKKISPALIYQVVRSEQTNRQQGSHKTKTRKEVAGGGKKPWRQKGTGNARQGSNRAPQWRGGGIVFGPQPRNYRIDLPHKQRKAGLRAILASRAQEKSVVSVLRGLQVNEYKTAPIYKVFRSMSLLPQSTVVFISDQINAHMLKSFANIRNVQLMAAERLCAPELYYAGRLVIAETALAYLEQAYSKKESAA